VYKQTDSKNNGGIIMEIIKFRYVYKNKNKVRLYDFTIDEIEGEIDRYFEDIKMSFSSFKKFNEYQKEEGFELINKLLFTGLKDKNGTEICEKDIVLLNKKRNGKIMTSFKAKVKFIAGAFYVKNFGLLSDWIYDDLYEVKIIKKGIE
jgi:hypothetical protein